MGGNPRRHRERTVNPWRLGACRFDSCPTHHYKTREYANWQSGPAQARVVLRDIVGSTPTSRTDAGPDRLVGAVYSGSIPDR